MTYRGWLVIWVLIFIFFTLPFLKMTAITANDSNYLCKIVPSLDQYCTVIGVACRQLLETRNKLKSFKNFLPTICCDWEVNGDISNSSLNNFVVMLRRRR